MHPSQTVLPGILTIAALIATGRAEPVASPVAPSDVQQIEFFELRIRPLLATNCYKCHGPQRHESNLRLNSLAAVLKGGDSGPAVVPGNLDESLLIDAVRYGDSVQMPPDNPLSADKVADLEKWVAMGAPWPTLSPQDEAKANRAARPLFNDDERTFWSFQPPQEPPLPEVREASWPRSPIDRFILAALEQKDLKPAIAADKATLLRRASFGLTGFPPTPAELEAFVADDSSDAFAKVIDRLLASHHYGEQWARHWMDVVRYADCLGGGANLPFANAHRYRDYVIAAFNKDKPFDRFVQEQLAGDLLPPGDTDAEIDRHTAPGVLLLGPYANKEKMDVAADQISMLTRAFIGLNIACARCHDHPYEPLPTQDFYALAGIFTSTYATNDGTGNQTGMSDKWFERELAMPTGEKVMVLSVREGQVENLKVHHRGDANNLGDEAPRRFPCILAGEDQPPLSGEHSGRLELAQWLSRPEHPLTARVIVNRVWQRHFGVGLVRDPDNFGMSAPEKPTNQALLDWLAVQFVRSGWSIKSLQRTILLSAAYQMSCAQNAKAADVDPENRLLWRQNRRRLEAEEIRDSLLRISGQLDATTGGSAFAKLGLGNKDDLTDKGRLKLVTDHYQTMMQRTVYLPVIRGEMHMAELLDIFDFPGRDEMSGRRATSTTAPQSLLLMNSPFVLSQAQHTVEKLLAANVADDSSRVRLLYQMLAGRMPTDDDTRAAIGYLQSFEAAGGQEADATNRRAKAWQDLCHAVFMLNEFVYLN